MGGGDWLGALGERNFRRFYVGQTTSSIGNGMAFVAVTFAVLAHGTATDVGLVSAAGLTPVVVFLLIGGVFADRISRRLQMLTSDLVRALAELALGGWVLAAHAPLWAFMALAAVQGVGSAFFNPAMTGLLPQVVSGARLQQANALMGISTSAAGIIGPALAGLIIAVLNPGWAIVIDGLTYVVSVASLVLVRIEWTAVPRTASMLQELRRGWSEFWSRTWLWVIVLEFSVVNVLIFAPVSVLGPVIAKQSLGGAPAWGAILAVQGAGSIVGGIVMLRWRPARPLLVATAVVAVSAWPLCALALRAPVPVIAAGMFVDGVALATFGALWATTMQREIPNEVLSRVSAYDWFGSLVFLPIGLGLIGPIARACGLTATILGAAALLVAFVVATLFVPDVTRLRARDGDARAVAAAAA